MNRNTHARVVSPREATGANRFVSKVMLVLLCASASSLAFAQLDQVVQTGEAKAQEGKQSQAKIDSIVDAQQGKLIKYRALLKQIDGLEQYNDQLSTQVKGQEALIQQFKNSIDQVAEIERQMLPLIIRMEESLTDFVDLDLPFHEIERQERLDYVSKSIERADVSVAEKFRQIIEAYQIEMDYGRKIDSYHDIVSIDGAEQEVDVLRFGRVALVAQTPDAKLTAVYNNKTKAWESLPSTYRNSVRHGIRMAKKQASIDILTMPVAAPEAAQ